MIPRPHRIAINGATGRMGRALLNLLSDDPRFELVAALTSAHASECDLPIAQGHALRFTTDWHDLPAMGVLIDFSTPEGLAAALDHCVPRGIALVTGTTGYDVRLAQRLDTATQRIPLLRSANFSLGVAVLSRLLSQAATALIDWDLEIIEAHHRHKQDAPSGTALMLGEIAATARGTTLTEQAVYAREGRPGARKAGSIGFAVIRGGDIVGEHSALLIGHGERVELAHRATDRAIFARGAIEAAHWLAGRAPGGYDLNDLLASRGLG